MSSVFDRVMLEADSRPKHFTVYLDMGINFVFKRDEDWAEMCKIEQKAAGAEKGARGNMLPPSFKDSGVREDPTQMHRASHLASRHVGFEIIEQDGEETKSSFTEEKWEELQFLQFAQKNPQAFKALMWGLNQYIGVSYHAQDVDYILEKKSD